MNITVALHDGEDLAISTSVLSIPDGPWIALRLGGNLSVYLPGFGPSCATYARRLAETLIAAAQEVVD